MQYYKDHFSDKNYRQTFLVGALFLIISFFANLYSTIYATYASSGSVADIILSNTRVYDVDLLFVYGTVILFLFTLFLALRHLHYAPFIMKSVAVFTIIRAVFVTLTHISPFPSRVLISSQFFQYHFFNGIFTGNDLFFSGHTGIPFLMALLFWHNKKLRLIFLSFSLFFAIVVLLGHLHYSIDVLSAFFITYAIFDICKFLFKKDWQLFLKE